MQLSPFEDYLLDRELQVWLRAAGVCGELCGSLGPSISENEDL